MKPTVVKIGVQLYIFNVVIGLYLQAKYEHMFVVYVYSESQIYIYIYIYMYIVHCFTISNIYYQARPIEYF